MPMRFEIDGRTGSTALEDSRWEVILNTRVRKLGNSDRFHAIYKPELQLE